MVAVLNLADGNTFLRDCTTGSSDVFEIIDTICGSVDVGIEHFLKF